MLSQTIELLISLKEAARMARIRALSAAVHLTKRHLFAVPRQLSNGPKQRGAITRAFASDPQMLICDEPTSALDGSVQTAILNCKRRRRSVIF